MRHVQNGIKIIRLKIHKAIHREEFEKEILQPDFTSVNIKNFHKFDKPS